MVKQISLDAWQIQHLEDLLEKGSNIVAKTNRPIVLYRQTLEEEDSPGRKESPTPRHPLPYADCRGRLRNSH